MYTQKQIPSYRPRTDLLGLAASALCILHCAGTAIFPFVLPALGFTFLLDERLHRLIAATVVCIGMLAFIPGFRMHKSMHVLTLAIVGLSAIALSQLVGESRESLEVLLTVLGGSTLIVAHIRNRALCKKFHCSSCVEKLVN